MTEIRAIYTQLPAFPATDQHPDAKRYQIAQYWVDAIGGEPTKDEVTAIMSPPEAPPSRDALAEIAALTAALVKKNIVTETEVEAETSEA